MATVINTLHAFRHDQSAAVIHTQPDSSTSDFCTGGIAELLPIKHNNPRLRLSLAGYAPNANNKKKYVLILSSTVHSLLAEELARN